MTVHPVRRTALTDRGFLRQYLRMLAAMAGGTLAGSALCALAGTHGAGTSDPVAPEVHALLMATWMTVGMAAWMAWQRPAWTVLAELGLVTYASFVVLFPAYWAGTLTSSALLVAGHVLMLPATAAVMLHRR